MLQNININTRKETNHRVEQAMTPANDTLSQAYAMHVCVYNPAGDSK